MYKDVFPILNVSDGRTGGYPCVAEIARTEDWAKGLVYFNMLGFALFENGTLILMDGYGHYRVCPEGRFEVKVNEQQR